MDKRIHDKLSLNKNLLILQPSKNNNLQCGTAQSTENNKISDNIIDYRNISVPLKGEVSSSSIQRNNLTQTQPNISLAEDTDDDEQFIKNMKEIIDKNHTMRNKENYSVRNLQSQSYLSRKKKCVFSDEDQNLMKRFKKSVDENEVLCTIPQKVQQSENVTSVSTSKCSMISSPKVTTTSTVVLNTVNTNNTELIRCNTNQLLSYMTSQKNDQFITPRNTEHVIETRIVEEIDQLVYCEMYLTPPERDENLLS
ncbi:uncharacterized protein LOC114943435 [Nylanderia fulva]|uniref:uncharacterized protein LOC114943435 n=1 Tax=Nylanderia fulva TaxID=613905 RepID=UPI0010FB20BC|nr:uncharacterized protein LOC114943435 [Nylanderia fulva]XP_029174890.1 uncharacterized protein LOC114943435 [Nylanderia fulva]XP_029174891.1 uncharacterized protein LOC114943435 [Nylanderia fulva]